MTYKKHLLRRTAAIITSIVFMFTGSGWGFVTADEAAVTQHTEETTEILHVTEPVTAPETGEITEEISEVTTVMPSERPYRQTSLITIKCRGEKKISVIKAVNALFNNIFISARGDDFININYYEDKPLETRFKDSVIRDGDDIYFSCDDQMYLLENLVRNGTDYRIEVIDCYDVSYFGELNAKIWARDEKYRGKKYVPYGTWFSVLPPDGWKAEREQNIAVRGAMETSIIQSESGYTLFARTENVYIKIPIWKTGYTVGYTGSDDISLKVNGTDGMKYNGLWLDDSDITVDIKAGEKFRSKITGVKITDSVSGTSYPMEIKGDGKNVTASLDISVLGTEYEDGKEYNLSFDTVPDKIDIFAFENTDGGSKPLKNVEVTTRVENENVYLQLPPLIYENGTAGYVIESYETDNKTVSVDSRGLLEKGEITRNIDVTYSNDYVLNYRKILKDAGEHYLVNSKGKKISDNVYSFKLSPITELMNFEVDGKAQDCLVLYDEVKNDNTYKQNNYSFDSIFSYLPERNSRLESIRTNSLLYYSNGEFHNMLQEPLYFYFDNHAPEVVLTNTDEDTLDNNIWGAESYTFQLKCDDRERFSEVPGAGDDVNEIYRNIDGAYSEITEINAGGTVLQKTDGKWKVKPGTENRDYDVKAESDSDTEFSVTVRVKKESSVFEASIPVTVTDSCGNTSEPQKIELKTEKEIPVVSSVKIESAKLYTDPHFGRSAGIGAAAFTAENPGTVNCDIEIKENYSGLSKIMVSYVNSEKSSSFFRIYRPDELKASCGLRQEGDRYFMSIPIPADFSTRNKLSVAVQDFAGNTDECWYTGSEPVREIENASLLVFDTDRPDADVSVEELSSYTDSNDRRWYRTVPDFTAAVSDEYISASGADIRVNSGISCAELTVNGKTVKTADVTGNQKVKYTVYGVQHSDNPDVFDVYYRDVTETEESGIKIVTADLRETDGKITVGAVAYDAAGNISEKSEHTVYVDANPPQPDKYFSVTDGNLRKFGTFLNHGTKLRVGTSEPAGRPSSGLNSAVLEFAGKKYYCTFETGREKYAEFELPFESGEISGTAVVTLRDNAGNTFTSDSLVSDKGSDVILFEKNAPQVSDLSDPDAVKYTEGEVSWYSAGAEIKLCADDTLNGSIYSGLGTAETVVNGRRLESACRVFSDDTNMTGRRMFSFSTEEVAVDGAFEVIFRTSDNAGNSSPEFRKTVAVDSTAPEITGMSINGGESIAMQVLDGVYTLPYGYFFRDSAVLTIFAGDMNSSSGMKEIHFDLYDYDGRLISENMVSGGGLKAVNGVYSADFTVPEGFRGFFKAWAMDNVGNRSLDYTHNGFILENEARHRETSSVEITLPETSYTDRNGLPLYSSDISAAVTVRDSFSGIRKFEWLASEYGSEKWKHFDVKDGEITGDSAQDFKSTAAEKNLLCEISGGILLTEDRNSGSLKIRMTDNSENTSEDSRNFSIDRKAPVISVSYDSAESDSSSGIFRDQRTASISVSERNFDPDRMNISVDGNSSGVSFGSWSLAEGREGEDSAVYRMPVTFSGNGEYVLKAEGRDICDNSAAGYTSDKFVIDRTAPVLEVSSSGAELLNGRYWNGPRTVTVRITEHNFDAKRIRITGTAGGSEEDFPEVSGFVSSGDVHTAVIVFSDDTDYTLRIEGEDAAGNGMESFSESFTVDGTAPEIIFDGVKDRSANRGDVSLRVLVNEASADEKLLKVKISGANRGDISSGAFVAERTAEGFVCTFAEFAEEKSVDDIYTVEVSAEDLAGHSASDTLTFSVNRFGSTYVFDDSTVAVSGTYIKKPVDIVLHEINADELDMKRTAVSVIKDNERIMLEPDTDYSIELSGGDGSWCDYRYEISASNFKDDAAYSVVVYSEDAAGNINDSTDDDKKAELRFGVDQTPPRCIPVNIEDNASFRAESLDVEFVCEDNILLDGVSVFVDGTDVSSEVKSEGSKYGFTLLSSENPHSVKFVLSDIAGNETELVVNNVLVTTNAFMVFFRKYLGIGLALLVIIIAGVWCAAMMLKKRKVKKIMNGEW